MLRIKQFVLSRYSVAVFTSLLALLLRFLLNPLLGKNAPLLVFILPVMFSAWYGGFRPGLLATMLSALIGTYFFVPSYFSFDGLDIAQSTNIAIFLFEGVFISWLSESLRRTKQRAERSTLNLEEQEEQYRLLVETVKDYAIFGLDASGFVTSWNSGAELIKGYKAAEIIGRHFSIFYPEEAVSQGQPEHTLQSAISKGHYENEGWRQRKDGSLFWANVVVTALRNPSGDLCGFSKVVRDMTDRKRSEQALQESYSLLDRIIEGTTDAVFIKNRQGRYQLVNSTSAQAFGRPRAEVLGKNDLELLSSESAAALQQIDRAVMETGISRTLEEVLQRGNERRIFFTTKDPLRDAEGNIIGLIGIARDITERKQVEEQLQRSVQRLRSLHQLDHAILNSASSKSIAEGALSHLAQIIPFDQAAVLLFDLDKNQGTILAGEMSGDIAGSRFLVSERVDLEILRNRSALYYVEDLAQLNDRPVAFDRPSAEYHSFMAVAMRIEGALIGDLVLTARQPAAFGQEHQEIAQEVAAQLAIAIQQARLREQLQQYTDELEQRVGERTIALQEANDSLEAFSYSASHDLRAPLRSMRGLSLALLEDYAYQLDTTAQLYAEEIAASAQQADQLVADLLEYARLVRVKITLQPLNLTQLMAEVFAQIENDLQASRAEITVRDSLPDVMGYSPTLKQVILNLMTNALKFVPADRQPRIDIWAERRSGRVRLWIQDNGLGIAPQHQERIFQPFERLHAIETYPGTGVGLAIVRRGIERMGGSVGVESELGQGSRFWLELRGVDES